MLLWVLTTPAGATWVMCISLAWVRPGLGAEEAEPWLICVVTQVIASGMPPEPAPLEMPVSGGTNSTNGSPKVVNGVGSSRPGSAVGILSPPTVSP